MGTPTHVRGFSLGSKGTYALRHSQPFGGERFYHAKNEVIMRLFNRTRSIYAITCCWAFSPVI